MPVTLITNQSGSGCQSRVPHDEQSAENAGSSRRELVIGLLNNMSAGALEATERQFTLILNSASKDFSIRLKRYFLPEVAQSEPAAVYRDLNYGSIESLWSAKLDGLIVTGREPLTPNLRDEPYWDSFVRVIEWARDNTCSTTWSCLAAHAAVLHMDGIQRVRSEEKKSGIFDCARISDHPIAANVPDRFRLPHSRWNGLAEPDLTGCGYEVITRIDNADVDCFIKQERSLFLFFQGHPEYQSETLLLEYRRDVGRFLRGESAAYPSIPQGYFDENTSRELFEIRRRATGQSHEETLAQLIEFFSATGQENAWHATASTIYRNWLEYISSEKELRTKTQHTVAATVPKAALESCDLAAQ